MLGDKPLEFNYSHDGDENGALYYLGTCGYKREWLNPHRLGLVKSYFSSLRTGGIDDFVGRVSGNCSTLNEKNSFMAVDLGEGRKLMPSCYSIINRLILFYIIFFIIEINRNLNTHVMLNWVLEASLDN